MSLRVAGAQLPITLDIDANLAGLNRALDFAAQEKADLLLTPEGSLSGYTPHFDTKHAEKALQEITQRAASLKIGLALGTCFLEPEDGRCYNQVRFYDTDGSYLGFHSKTLTCGTMTDAPQGEINHYAVSPLRTFEFQGVTIGALICNDLWANPGCTPQADPHLTHLLAKMGAKVIFHAVNGGRDGGRISEIAWRYHESNLQMRALASRLWIVTADCATPETLPCSSPSGVVSPDGSWSLKAPRQGEQYFVFDIPL